MNTGSSLKMSSQNFSLRAVAGGQTIGANGQLKTSQLCQYLVVVMITSSKRIQHDEDMEVYFLDVCILILLITCEQLAVGKASLS